jgi:2-methylaconitate cis-trans-isomerase PrpF
MMRGGTSKGPFLRIGDLPADKEARDEFLLRMMGSGQELEIDGVGGGHPLSSKVAMVDRSGDADADVDYLFAQVGVIERFVDTGPNCGNMLAAVGPYAIETGLMPATHPETTIRIRNLNTNSLIDAVIQTPDGAVTYAGSASIDGVPGQAAPVKLTFRGGLGSKTGKLLPTGLPSEVIQGVEVTLIDMTVPVMMLAAASLGKSGYETSAELDNDQAFLKRLESLRCEAGLRMGLGDVSGRVIPKVILVAEPEDGGSICGRYFMPRRCHGAFAATGAICLTAACLLEGTIAARYVVWSGHGSVRSCTIEHPSGQIHTEIETKPDGTVKRVSLVRTARKLFAGEVFVP